MDSKEYASYGQFVQKELDQLKEIASTSGINEFHDVDIKEVIENATFIVAEVMESLEPFDLDIIMEYQGEKHIFTIYEFDINNIITMRFNSS